MLEHTPNYIPLIVFSSLIFVWTVSLMVVRLIMKARRRW